MVADTKVGVNLSKTCIVDSCSFRFSLAEHFDFLVMDPLAINTISTPKKS